MIAGLAVDEALVIADSALRHGEQATLARAVALVRGRGQQQASRIARNARGESANALRDLARFIAERES